MTKLLKLCDDFYMDPNIQNSQENAPENQTIIVKIRSILSQNKFLIIVVTALTIISFGTTSYLLVAGSNKSFKPPRQENNLTTSEALPTLQPQPSTDPTSQPTQTLNPELQKDETATWSAFTSSKYSYSISYPPAWNASLADQEDEKILEYVVFNPESASGSATPAISLSYGTRTYQEALNIYQSGENITVGSQSATKIQNQNSDGNQSVTAVIPDGIRTIVIYAQKQYEQFIDQMLTTLILK